MSFKELLNSDKFLITAEIGPPKGVDIEPMLSKAMALKGKVDAINITDQQSSVMRLGSLAGCCILKREGMETIFQVTCRDRNRIALQSDLLSAFVLGLENVLCLTGDYVGLGDHPQAKGVFDLDSVSLLQAARQLEQGYDLAGNELTGKPCFCLGATVTPGADPLEPQLIKMDKKIKMGARFIQTQAVFDLCRFKSFMHNARRLNNRVKIMAGILLLTKAKMATYIDKNIPGIVVPPIFIDQLEASPEASTLKTGIEIAGQLIRQIHEEKVCDGVHIMAIGKEEMIPEILASAGF